ncbi:MAG: tetratricopeptide repeat protein [Myxococcota bacterium]
MPRIPRWRGWAVGIGWGVPLVLMGVLQLVPGLTIPSEEGVRWQPLQPGELAVRYEQAEQALKAGSWDEAQRLFENLREESPLNPLILAQLSTVYRRQSKEMEALASLKLALEQDPGLKEGWYNLACLQLKQGWRADALSSLRTAIQAGLEVRRYLPTDPDLQGLLADPWVQLYLEGASTIPTHDRTLTVRVEPSMVNPGQEVRVWIELLGLGQGETPPSGASVRWEGGAQLLPLEPLSLEVQRAVGVVDGRGWSRWTLEARLRARAAGPVMMGPWLGKVEGVQVTAAAQPLWVALGMGKKDEDIKRYDVNDEVKEEGLDWRPHAFFLFDAQDAVGPERGSVLRNGDVLTGESLEVVVGPLRGDRVEVRGEGGGLSNAAVVRTLRFEDGSTWWVEERGVLEAPQNGKWAVRVKDGSQTRTLASSNAPASP